MYKGPGLYLITLLKLSRFEILYNINCPKYLLLSYKTLSEISYIGPTFVYAMYEMRILRNVIRKTSRIYINNSALRFIEDGIAQSV
jgi:hypothetical protein